MHDDETLIGIETHIRIILDVIGRITLLIEAENKRMLKDGNAHAVLGNHTLHQRKLQLYQKFETLARIIGHIAKAGEFKDKELAASMIPSILRLQHAITVNSAFLKNHIERQQRLLTAIMRGIEKESASNSSHIMELDICL
jgi:hypothetical protein